jgi:hypothetical protein
MRAPKGVWPQKLAGFDRWSVGKSYRIAGNEHEYFGCVTEAVVANGEPVQEVVRNMVQEDYPLADASQ